MDSESLVPADMTAEEDAPDTLASGPVAAYESPPGERKLPDLGPASYSLILKLAVPTLVEQMLNGVIGFTDTFVAGHLAPEGSPGAGGINAAATAAVGTMTYLQWFSGLMISALGVGATAIVARSIGARRVNVANRVAGTALSAAFLVGVALAVSLYMLAGPVVGACGLKGMAFNFGVQYLRIMAITVCLQTAGQIGMACLRGAGDTFRPMLITSTIALLNVILVPCLANGWLGLPRLGIQGNALGTAIAFAISGVLSMGLLASGWSRLRLRRRHLKIVPHILMRVLRIGLPSWAEGMLLWGGQFLIVIVVINRNDAALASVWGLTQDAVDGVTMAAHQATLRIESFAFLPGFGFGIAASTLVGQYLGSGRPEEARVAARKTAWLAFLLMTAAALPMVFVPGWIMRGVVNSGNVAEVGLWPMVLAGLAQPGFAIAIIAGAALKGAGDTVSVMISTITGMFLIRFPLVLALVWVFTRFGHGEWSLLAVWFGIFADLNYRAVFNSVVFLRGKWRYTKV